MSSRPGAIGYVRRDISGTRQLWHETLIRGLAQRFGYDMRKFIVFGPHIEEPVLELIDVVQRHAVDAVFVHSALHFADEEIPPELVAVADVITVVPEMTYARWSTSELGGVWRSPDSPA